MGRRSQRQLAGRRPDGETPARHRGGLIGAPAPAPIPRPPSPPPDASVLAPLAGRPRRLHQHLRLPRGPRRRRPPPAGDGAGRRVRTSRCASRARPASRPGALSVRADSATWTDPATGAARTVATHRLSAVTFPGSSASPLPGSSASPLRALALGAGGGALAGAAVGALVYDLPHGPIDSHGDAAAFGAAGTGLLGGLIAGWVASDRRKDDLFLFSPQPDAPLADAAGGAASGPARRP